MKKYRLSGVTIDTSRGQFRHNCASVERRPELKDPLGCLAIYASKSFETNDLPTSEFRAEVLADYARAKDCVLAYNRDRNPYPHVTYGIKTVQLEIDQVSTEDLDAKCAELGRVPSNEEIRAMYKGPGRDEQYFAEAQEAAKQRAESPAMKKLQQSVQELLARGRSTR